MASKQLKESGKKIPRRKVRAGRFQISTWVFRQLFTNGGKDSTVYLEQWVDIERACIQYSTFNKATGQWENQAIWCSIDDLRNLAQVVDQLNGGDDSPPSFEYKDEEGTGNIEVNGFSHASEEKSQSR